MGAELGVAKTMAVGEYIRRELGFGLIYLEDDDGDRFAVLSFVPGFDPNTRWVMASPAYKSGRPTKATVYDTRGRLWHSQDIDRDMRLTQEYAVKDEPINVCEWTLRINEAVVLTGRGVRYDGYRMEG